MVPRKRPAPDTARPTPAEEAKEQLTTDLRAVRRRILETAADLGPGVRDEVFLGTWSARDLLAHLVGWDYTNLRAIDEVLDGQLPSFYEAHDRDWRTYNAILVKRYKDPDYRNLIRHARRSHAALIKRLRQTPAPEIRKDRGIRARGWKVTIERLLQAELSDERTHLEQLAGFAAIRQRTMRGRAG
jgi:hypothetical protein